MALIACPECRKQVSSKAISCPNCGLKLNLTPVEQGMAAAAAQARREERGCCLVGVVKLVVILVLLFFILVAGIAIMAPKDGAKDLSAPGAASKPSQ